MPVGDNILWFEEVSLHDTAKVGGKNASLGEMYSNLGDQGIRIPNGFAITASAYRRFIEENELKGEIKSLLKQINVSEVDTLKENGTKIRKLIEQAELSDNIREDIIAAFHTLQDDSKQNSSVVVRSSATAEDLPRASFAGQQDSFLNITKEKYILKAVKKSFASLFTDRAISYREKQGFSHLNIACSVGVQEMVDASEGSSGVMFTIDTETGCDNVILINSSFGFGEYVVKGRVNPDEFYVFKQGLEQDKDAIISSSCGSKEVKLIQGKNRGTKQKRLKKAERNTLSLQQEEVIQLAKWGKKIKEFYGTPQDIEWAKDGETGQLYILQARPETVESQKNPREIESYQLKQSADTLLTGVAIGEKIGAGEVVILDNPEDSEEFEPGQVLVTDMTNPDWEPIMEQAAAIVTEQGGKTSHAAIVARELGIPTIVGAENAKEKLSDQDEITIDCSQGNVGYIYQGVLPYEVNKQKIDQLPETDTQIKMNVGNPDHAFGLSDYPADGVGLARLEFIFSNEVKIHPLALVNYNQLENKQLKKKISKHTERFENKEEFCIKKLAEGIGKMSAAFYPNDVIIRFSDFKSNEYRNLIGGEKYEPQEENPMLGWRGASRYYSEEFKSAFRLECEAIKRARERWGLDNIKVMAPFCRTPKEGRKVLETMEEFGLKQDDLDIYVMAELPSNVVLAEKFAHMFDGISIGSNDLTQMVLGVDRDSSQLNQVYDENNPAVKEMVAEVINVAHRFDIPVGICGQAPSDSLEFTKFLVRSGIDSISLNPDVLIESKKEISEMEQTIGNTGDKSNSRLLALLIALGILSAILIVLGSGCSSLSSGTNNNSFDQSSFNKLTPAEIREQTKNKILAKQKKKLSNKMLPLEVSSFANFKIKYPYGWRVEYEENGIKFLNPDNSQYINFDLYNGTLQENTTTTQNFNSIEYDNRQAIEYQTTVSSTNETLFNVEILLKGGNGTNSDQQEDTPENSQILKMKSNYPGYKEILKTLKFKEKFSTSSLDISQEG